MLSHQSVPSIAPRAYHHCHRCLPIISTLHSAHFFPPSRTQDLDFAINAVGCCPPPAPLPRTLAIRSQLNNQESCAYPCHTFLLPSSSPFPLCLLSLLLSCPLLSLPHLPSFRGLLPLLVVGPPGLPCTLPLHLFFFFF